EHGYFREGRQHEPLRFSGQGGGGDGGDARDRRRHSRGARPRRRHGGDRRPAGARRQRPGREADRGDKREGRVPAPRRRGQRIDLRGGGGRLRGARSGGRARQQRRDRRELPRPGARQRRVGPDHRHEPHRLVPVRQGVRPADGRGRRLGRRRRERLLHQGLPGRQAREERGLRRGERRHEPDDPHPRRRVGAPRGPRKRRGAGLHRHPRPPGRSQGGSRRNQGVALPDPPGAAHPARGGRPRRGVSRFRPCERDHRPSASCRRGLRAVV
ncbi:MAG: 3-oxoacyl-[acyl-carrier protein] reductase, partial [uncultured Rubrobacteraceae bacterium]